MKTVIPTWIDSLKLKSSATIDALYAQLVRWQNTRCQLKSSSMTKEAMVTRGMASNWIGCLFVLWPLMTCIKQILCQQSWSEPLGPIVVFCLSKPYLQRYRHIFFLLAPTVLVLVRARQEALWPSSWNEHKYTCCHGRKSTTPPWSRAS